MTTLAQAIERRVAQARLVGWQMSRRRHIIIHPDGLHATLQLGWRTANSIQPAEPGAQRIGEHTITVDLDNLPKGVEVCEWTALPDTEDLIEVPTRAEMLQAATSIGCRYLDHMVGDGINTYCMVA